MSVADRDQVITDERLDSLERWRDEMETKWKAAFPGGDHVAHCGYHDLMIEDIRDRKRLIRAIKEKTIAGLVWAGVIALALALWQWFKTQVKGG